MRAWRLPVIAARTDIRLKCCSHRVACPPWRRNCLLPHARTLCSSPENQTTLQDVTPLDAAVSASSKNNLATAITEIQRELLKHSIEDAEQQAVLALALQGIPNLKHCTQKLENIRRLLCKRPDTPGEDPLHDLAIKQDAWQDFVWFSKTVIAAASLRTSKLQYTSDDLVERLKAPISLDVLTNKAIGYQRLEVPNEHLGPKLDVPLSALLRRRVARRLLHPDDDELLSRIWSALGTLTLACVHDNGTGQGAMRSEILEVLAAFHHKGLISPFVYSYTPTARTDAVQQPMILNLLSSHIIAGLTDAEWRARERKALSDAKARGEDTSSMHLELRGASVRATIGVLRPELWLELILWSCLHGGWRAAGLGILSAVCQQPAESSWRAISWTGALRAIMPFGAAAGNDWERLKFDFDTRRSVRTDKSELLGFSTERSISSEVISAYVDIFVQHCDADRQIEGLSVDEIMAIFARLQNLLRHSGATLQTGSWAAVLQRLMAAEVLNTNRTSDVETLVQLTPSLGEESSSPEQKELPSYVFDGNAALLGVLHRALITQVQLGNVSRAQHILTTIEECGDKARAQSAFDFFRAQNQLQTERSSRFSFTDNFDGIEYPLFDPQIPSTTAAMYIDLLTESRDFDKAQNVFSEELSNGIYVPRAMFADPTISMSLARLAAALDDNILLNKIVQARTEQDWADEWKSKPLKQIDRSKAQVLNVILEAHLQTGRSVAAARLMMEMRKKHSMDWDERCLAIAGQAVLFGNKHTDTSPKEEAQAAELRWSVFTAMLADITKAHLGRTLRGTRSAQLFGILCTLASADQRIAQLLHTFETQSFHTPSEGCFRIVLGAVARSRGNAAARSLVEKCCIELPSAIPLRRSSGANRSSRGDSSRRRDLQAADGDVMTVLSTIPPTTGIIALVVRHGLEEWTATRSQQSSDVSSKTEILSPQKLRRWARRLLSHQSSTDAFSDSKQEIAGILASIDENIAKTDASPEHGSASVDEEIATTDDSLEDELASIDEETATTDSSPEEKLA